MSAWRTPYSRPRRTRQQHDSPARGSRGVATRSASLRGMASVTFVTSPSACVPSAEVERTNRRSGRRRRQRRGRGASWSVLSGSPGVDRGQERHFIGGPQPRVYTLSVSTGDRDSHLSAPSPLQSARSGFTAARRHRSPCPRSPDRRLKLCVVERETFEGSAEARLGQRQVVALDDVARRDIACGHHNLVVSVRAAPLDQASR